MADEKEDNSVRRLKSILKGMDSDGKLSARVNECFLKQGVTLDDLAGGVKEDLAGLVTGFSDQVKDLLPPNTTFLAFKIVLVNGIANLKSGM